MITTPDGQATIADWSERAAVCASAACLAHCLALPLIIVLLPSLAAMLAISESFHLWMLGLAIPSAGCALVMGWRLHRVPGPLMAGLIGLILLAIGALIVRETSWEIPITVVGSLTLAIAHVLNWRLRHGPTGTCDCDCDC